ALPRIAQPWSRRRRVPHPSACAGRRREEIPRRCDGPACESPSSALREPALLFARVSLRRCRGSVSSASFSLAIPTSDSSFPRQGPLGLFPRFVGTMKSSELSSLVPRHFVAFVRRYQQWLDSFASCDREPDRTTLVCSAGDPPALLVETARLPRFLCIPLCSRRRSTAPAGPRSLALSGPR